MTRLAPSHSHIHYESCTTGGIITSEKQISIKSCAFHRQFPGMRGSRARFHFHLFFFCKICFNFLKFYAFSIETMTEMMIRVTAPLSPSSQCEFDMILTSRPIGYMHYIQYMCVYSQPINAISSIRFRFYCGSFAVAVAPVAAPVRCSSGGLYDL